MFIHLALFKFYWYDQLPAWSIHLAKAKSHTHIHIRRYLTQVISVLYTQRNRELTWALSNLIHSLEESLNSKCKLNVHVKLQVMCKCTTWKASQFCWKPGLSGSVPSHQHSTPITLNESTLQVLEQIFFNRFSLWAA